MAHDWESYFEEAKTTALPLPPQIAQALYEVYAYYNDEKCKVMARGDLAQAEEWRRVSVTLRDLASQAAASQSPVNVPILLLNPTYDVALKDFFAPRSSLE